MNLISEDRMKRDRGLGINSNRVVIKQIETPNRKAKGVKVDENTIIKEVACATKV
jgi:hypothetical protein